MHQRDGSGNAVMKEGARTLLYGLYTLTLLHKLQKPSYYWNGQYKLSLSKRLSCKL